MLYAMLHAVLLYVTYYQYAQYTDEETFVSFCSYQVSMITISQKFSIKIVL